MHVSRTALVLLMVLSTVLAGCAAVQLGRDFDLQVFQSQVERGKTTQAQVDRWLGPPKSTGVVVDTDGNKYDEWTYFYGEGRLHNMKQARLKILQIKFDQQGIVRGYNYSSEAK